MTDRFPRLEFKCKQTVKRDRFQVTCAVHTLQSAIHHHISWDRKFWVSHLNETPITAPRKRCVVIHSETGNPVHGVPVHRRCHMLAVLSQCLWTAHTSFNGKITESSLYCLGTWAGRRRTRWAKSLAFLAGIDLWMGHPRSSNKKIPPCRKQRWRYKMRFEGNILNGLAGRLESSGIGSGQGGPCILLFHVCGPGYRDLAPYAPPEADRIHRPVSDRFRRLSDLFSHPYNQDCR